MGAGGRDPTGLELIGYSVLLIVYLRYLSLVWIVITLYGIKATIRGQKSIGSLIDDIYGKICMAFLGPLAALVFIVIGFCTAIQNFKIFSLPSYSDIVSMRDAIRGILGGFFGSSPSPRGKIVSRGEWKDGGVIQQDNFPTKLYQYQPLDTGSEIRLLDIYPGHYADPLIGEIVSADLSSKPRYDALSYTWANEAGDARRLTHILLAKNGGTIRITENCETAIRRLRLTHKTRRVWIDAVCIDQDSHIDRDHQVSLMSEIYMTAAHIVVYTGKGTNSTDKLFDWLNGLSQQKIRIPLVGIFEDMDELDRGILTSAIRHWNSAVTIRTWLNTISIALERFWGIARAGFASIFGNPEPARKIVLSKTEISRLVKIYFKRRWFQRVWVLQEATLPDVHKISVICGTRTTTGERALHLCTLLQDDKSFSLMRIFVLVRKRVPGSKKSHLLDILIETRHRRCLNPRDKIFGVLSIARGLDKRKFPELKASYGQSVSTVYANFSAFFIRHHGPGFFLSLIKSKPKRDGLPSWAADWTVPWPNYKAVQGRDFPAASRASNIPDYEVGFGQENGREVLILQRPRVLLGYFTRNGHMDGSNETHVEAVQSLPEDEILIEMYPGLAALLHKCDAHYVFVRICPHGLSKNGVEKLVEMWSSVVVDGKLPEQTKEGLEDTSYRGPLETYKIF